MWYSRNKRCIFYQYDSDAIIVCYSASRSSQHVKPIFQEITQLLIKKTLQLNFMKIDNEASSSILNYLQNENVHYQLVPPNNHRANIAERAMQTFKIIFSSVSVHTIRIFLFIYDTEH